VSDADAIVDKRKVHMSIRLFDILTGILSMRLQEAAIACFALLWRYQPFTDREIKLLYVLNTKVCSGTKPRLLLTIRSS